MNRLVGAALLATTLACASEPRPRPVGSAPAKAPSFQFEAPTKSLGPRSADPVARIQASGHIALLSTEAAAEGGAGKDLYLHHSMGGDGYERGPRINTRPGEVLARAEATPQLVSGPGMRLCAFWLARLEKEPASLRYRCSGDFGRSWSEVATIDTGTAGGPAFFSAATSPKGLLLATWFSFDDNGNAELWHSVAQKGAGFGAPRKVADHVCPCCRPAVAAAPDRLYIAYRGVDSHNVRDVVITRSDDGGERWSAPTPISADGWRINGCPHSGPSLGIDGQRLVVAWLSVSDERSRLFWTESLDGGLTFAPRKLLGGSVLDPNHPSLALLDGRWYGAYEARDPGEAEGWGARRVYLEELGSEHLVPVPASANASYPRLASLSAGALFLSWTHRSEGGPEARLARVRVAHR